MYVCVACTHPRVCIGTYAGQLGKHVEDFGKQLVEEIDHCILAEQKIR